MSGQQKTMPRKWYHSLCSSFVTGPLPTKRNGDAMDIPQIPVVSLEFFKTVTPTVPNAMLQAVSAKLKDGKSITCHVLKLAKAIMRAGKDHTGQDPCMEMSPTSTSCRIRHNDSRPDSFGSSLVVGYHKNGEFLSPDPISWSGIILAMENNDNGADGLEIFQKMMWSGRRILRNDPRRNFCFGITTEKAVCRLWFFARSHVMVTEPFDCNTDHAPLVRFILSLSFAHVLSTPSPQFSQYTVGEDPSARPISSSSPLTATSSQSADILAEPTSGDVSADASRVYSSVNYDFALEEHGYDPTMQRLRHGVYRIRVGDKWYITAGTLSDSRAERICGRCTRVWRVYEDKKYEEGEEKVYYVLKDVWVESSNSTEATIWRRLKEKVNPEVFDPHFLTLVAAFEPGEGATTCGFLRRGSYSHTENVDFMDSQFTGILDLEPSPSIPEEVFDPCNEEDRFYIKGAPYVEPPARRAKKRPRYHPRTHDRSVWKELCETYHDQDDMQVMFTMLEHAVKALKAMWEDAHAIHRDISTGNILYDSENGRLGDLEYVVFYDDEPSPVHNAKTGTLQFMAVEVSDGAFQFRPSAVAEDVFLATTDVLPLGAMPVSPFRHPFRHNVLHDLESIWWLVMWSIFKYYPENVRLEVQALKNQRRTYEALFSPIITLDKERRNALANEDPRFVSSIAPPFSVIGQLALRLRDMLTVSYRIAEAMLPIKSDCQVFLPAFDTTAVLLRHIKMSLEKDGIAGVTCVYELLYPQKRKAEETGDT